MRQLEASPATGIEDARHLAKTIANHIDWKDEVGVVGDHNGEFVVLLEAVQEEMRSKVDVGSLLLSIEDFHGARSRLRRGGEGSALAL